MNIKNKAYTISILSLLVVFFSTSTQASEKICSLLLSSGVHDRNSTFTTDQKFQQAYQFLSSNTFEKYSNAVAASADLGINIIDIIDASLGGKTSENNYTERRRQFLNVTQSSSGSRYNYINHIEKVSSSLVNAFTRCVETTQGFHTWVEPGRNLSTFVINAVNKADGAPITVEKITILPKDNSECDVTTPYDSNSNSVTIACSKPAESTVMVSMVTNKGNLKGINVNGNRDVIHELRMQINKLIASGGLVPEDTVAFLASNACPTGWTEFTELRGRYVVGLLQNGTLKKTVGAPLADGESRNNPGLHNHTFHDTMFAHQNGWNDTPNGSHDGNGLNARWQGDGSARRGSMKKTTSQTGTNDTNSPYIQLLACIKL